MKNAVKDGDMKKVVEVAATGIKIIGGKLASRIPAKK